MKGKTISPGLVNLLLFYVILYLYIGVHALVSETISKYDSPGHSIKFLVSNNITETKENYTLFNNQNVMDTNVTLLTSADQKDNNFSLASITNEAQDQNLPTQNQTSEHSDISKADFNLSESLLAGRRNKMTGHQDMKRDSNTSRDRKPSADPIISTQPADNHSVSGGGNNSLNSFTGATNVVFISDKRNVTSQQQIKPFHLQTNKSESYASSAASFENPVSSLSLNRQNEDTGNDRHLISYSDISQDKKYNAMAPLDRYRRVYISNMEHRNQPNSRGSFKELKSEKNSMLPTRFSADDKQARLPVDTNITPEPVTISFINNGHPSLRRHIAQTSQSREAADDTLATKSLMYFQEPSKIKIDSAIAEHVPQQTFNPSLDVPDPRHQLSPNLQNPVSTLGQIIHKPSADSRTFLGESKFQPFSFANAVNGKDDATYFGASVHDTWRDPLAKHYNSESNENMDITGNKVGNHNFLEFVSTVMPKASSPLPPTVLNPDALQFVTGELPTMTFANPLSRGSDTTNQYQAYTTNQGDSVMNPLQSYISRTGENGSHLLTRNKDTILSGKNDENNLGGENNNSLAPTETLRTVNDTPLSIVPSYRQLYLATQDKYNMAAPIMPTPLLEETSPHAPRTILNNDIPITDQWTSQSQKQRVEVFQEKLSQLYTSDHLPKESFVAQQQSVPQIISSIANNMTFSENNFHHQPIHPSSLFPRVPQTNTTTNPLYPSPTQQNMPTNPLHPSLNQQNPSTNPLYQAFPRQNTPTNPLYQSLSQQNTPTNHIFQPFPRQNTPTNHLFQSIPQQGTPTNPPFQSFPRQNTPTNPLHLSVNQQIHPHPMHQLSAPQHQLRELHDDSLFYRSQDLSTNTVLPTNDLEQFKDLTSFGNGVRFTSERSPQSENPDSLRDGLRFTSHRSPHLFQGLNLQDLSQQQLEQTRAMTPQPDLQQAIQSWPKQQQQQMQQQQQQKLQQLQQLQQQQKQQQQSEQQDFQHQQQPGGLSHLSMLSTDVLSKPTHSPEIDWPLFEQVSGENIQVNPSPSFPHMNGGHNLGHYPQPPLSTEEGPQPTAPGQPPINRENSRLSNMNLKGMEIYSTHIPPGKLQQNSGRESLVHTGKEPIHVRNNYFNDKLSHLTIKSTERDLHKPDITQKGPHIRTVDKFWPPSIHKDIAKNDNVGAQDLTVKTTKGGLKQISETSPYPQQAGSSTDFYMQYKPLETGINVNKVNHTTTTTGEIQTNNVNRFQWGTSPGVNLHPSARIVNWQQSGAGLSGPGQIGSVYRLGTVPQAPFFQYNLARPLVPNFQGYSGNQILRTAYAIG